MPECHPPLTYYKDIWRIDIALYFNIDFSLEKKTIVLLIGEVISDEDAVSDIRQTHSANIPINRYLGGGAW